MPSQFKSSIRDNTRKWNGWVSSRDWKNPTSLQLTFAFEPLTHQPPQHFSAMVTEGWRSIRMHKESMRPDLKVFKCSRSCNRKIIQGMSKISDITNTLRLRGNSSQNKGKHLFGHCDDELSILYWWLYCILKIKRFMTYHQTMVYHIKWPPEKE